MLKYHLVALLAAVLIRCLMVAALDAFITAELNKLPAQLGVSARPAACPW